MSAVMFCGFLSMEPISILPIWNVATFFRQDNPIPRENWGTSNASQINDKNELLEEEF